MVGLLSLVFSWAGSVGSSPGSLLVLGSSLKGILEDVSGGGGRSGLGCGGTAGGIDD